MIRRPRCSSSYVIVSGGLANLDPQISGVSAENRFSASAGLGGKIESFDFAWILARPLLFDLSIATTWVPHPSLAGPDGSVPPELVWAALDCPGGWSSDLVARPMVLGRMTAAVQARPAVGERCVVVGRVLGTAGRKTFTASTAYDSDRRVLGHAESTWIALR